MRRRKKPITVYAASKSKKYAMWKALRAAGLNITATRHHPQVTVFKSLEDAVRAIVVLQREH